MLRNWVNEIWTLKLDKHKLASKVIYHLCLAKAAAVVWSSLTWEFSRDRRGHLVVENLSGAILRRRKKELVNLASSGYLNEPRPNIGGEDEVEDEEDKDSKELTVGNWLSSIRFIGRFLGFRLGIGIDSFVGLWHLLAILEGRHDVSCSGDKPRHPACLEGREQHTPPGHIDCSETGWAGSRPSRGEAWRHRSVSSPLGSWGWSWLDHPQTVFPPKNTPEH